MWRYTMTLLLIMLCGVLLLPRGAVERNRRVTPDPETEMKAKHTLLSKDIQATDDLCRSQCILSLQQTARDLGGGKQQVAQALKKLQKEHPHMKTIYWSDNNQDLTQAIVAGEPNGAVNQLASADLAKAKENAKRGETFLSKTIEKDGEPYMVAEVPTADGKASLIAVVHQQILKQVKDHQVKNLRIATFPNSGNYKIKTVEPHTLQDVKVNHPEDNQGVSHYHKNEVVVKFRTPPTDEQLKQIQSEIQSEHMRKLGHNYVFRSKTMEARQLMQYFNNWNVHYSEPHFLYLTNETASPLTPVDPKVITPNDTLYSRYQWNLPNIDTERGWALNKGASDVIVGVVDTGVDMDHADLQGRLAPGYNFIDRGSRPMDDVGHGTHVSGVISANVNNGIGIAGMNWFGKIMPVKVLDSSGTGNTYSVAEGIIWAADHGAKVINMSLGNYANAQFLHDAIRYAFDKDVVLIAASGNDNSSEPGYPAAYPEVLAVAATDSQKKKASFSNYGDYIGVSAPGVNIASTYPHNQYAALSGTSMASPHVTALAALIRAANPDLKNTEVMEVIRQSAKDLGPKGRDPYYGFGEIDVASALQLATKQSVSPAVNNETNPPRPDSWLPAWLRRWFG